MASRRCRRASATTLGSPSPPDEMFGKVMSISDELMWRYYMLLTDESEAAVKAIHSA